MKVRVTLTVDVDPDAWALAYGTGGTAAEVREDVRTYVVGQVRDSAAAQEGGIREVQVAC